jgi:hypothetical protein
MTYEDEKETKHPYYTFCFNYTAHPTYSRSMGSHILEMSSNSFRSVENSPLYDDFRGGEWSSTYRY